MSSLNPYRTFHYSQPSDYRFSHDSVFLSRYVFEQTQSENLCYTQVLDLCSGCGIVGLDFIYHVQTNSCLQPLLIDFVELQSNYAEHFDHNKTHIQSILNISADLNWINLNYQFMRNDDSYKNKYNLALCNPPYFRLGQGRLSGSEFKNRCRFYIDSSLVELIKCIDHCLAPDGRAYVLIKDLSEHGIDVSAELKTLTDISLKFIKTGKIRQTDLFLFEKIG